MLGVMEGPLVIKCNMVL